MNPKELCTREKNCAQGKINQLDARNGCSKKWLHERQRDHCWCTSDDLEIFRELELFKEAHNPRMDWDLQSKNNSRNLDIQDQEISISKTKKSRYPAPPREAPARAFLKWKRARARFCERNISRELFFFFREKRNLLF